MEQLDLTDFFKTKAQALDFSIRLSTISQKIFETNFSLEKELMDQLGIKKKDKFVTILRDNNINESSQDSLKEFFSMIQTKIASLSIITLTLAIEPKEQTLQVLSQWFVTNVNKQVLFDITVDPLLIGGAAIYFNSKYLDYSIKPKFEQILKETVTNIDVVTPLVSAQAIVDTNENKHQNIENISFGR